MCLIYFFIVLLLTTISYFAGQSLFKILNIPERKGFYLNLFLKSLVGSCFLITFISIIYTGGKTINLIFILIALFLFIEKKLQKTNIILQEKQETENYFTKKNILSALLLIGVIFLWQARILLKTDSGFVMGIEPDNFYYAEISKCLISTGQENSFTTANLISEQYHFVTPYHYYDLWLNGFASKIFGLNYALSLYLITYTFFTALFLFGLLACFENYTVVNFKHKLLSFLLLFTGGLYISEKVMNLGDSAQMESVTQHYGEKLAPVYCFVLLVLLVAIVFEKPKSALIISLYLPVISISLAPAVYGGIILYSIYKLFSKEKLFYFKIITFTCITVAVFACFYILFRKNELNFRLEKSLLEYTDLKTFSWFQIKFYLVELFLKSYYHPLLFVINHLPFILLIAFALLKKHINTNTRSLLALLTFILFSGLIAYNSFYLLDDAYQLYIHSIAIWHVLFTFIFIITISRPLKDKTPIQNILVAIFIISLLYKVWVSFFFQQKTGYKELSFSNEYLKSVELICNELEPDSKGGIYYGPEFYNKQISTLPIEYYYFPFVFANNIYVAFNLSGLQSVSKNSIYQNEKLLSKSAFNTFQKQNLNDSTNLLSQQIAFIQKYNLKYIIKSGSEKTDFSKYFKIKTILKDSISGQEFIVLRNS